MDGRRFLASARICWESERGRLGDIGSRGTRRVARLAAITYDGLPIANGGAHRLRTRGCVAGLEALQSFVAAVSLDLLPTKLSLEVLEGADVAEGFASAALGHLETRLSKRTSRRVGHYTAHRWTMNRGALSSTADALERLRPIPNTRYGGYAARLHASWDLVLCDSSRRAFPHQSERDYVSFDCGDQHRLGRSFVHASISEATTAHLFLSLPFEEVTEEARGLVSEIQAHFPARLSSSHWKIWRLARSGQAYVGRKIPGLAHRRA
jgi:hypothetical protein